MKITVLGIVVVAVVSVVVYVIWRRYSDAKQPSGPDQADNNAQWQW